MDQKNLRLTCQVSQDQVSSNMVDRISELPDVILVTIVSCLRALMEKVATSILSKRWRYVWVYSTYDSRLSGDLMTCKSMPTSSG
ncbi:hypothetical protein PRUPE_1G404500 [Prunus persica]|uniref:F-box domain-containing protein n=1 Tax=Prunus persica TaxID=3760 RepID=A0A251RAL4_PRUPE|nr:hypothetical protein PRUPE_1G404500 [Prunus persica]